MLGCTMVEIYSGSRDTTFNQEIDDDGNGVYSRTILAVILV